MRVANSKGLHCMAILNDGDMRVAIIVSPNHKVINSDRPNFVERRVSVYQFAASSPV